MHRCTPMSVQNVATIKRLPAIKYFHLSLSNFYFYDGAGHETYNLGLANCTVSSWNPSSFMSPNTGDTHTHTNVHGNINCKPIWTLTYNLAIPLKKRKKFTHIHEKCLIFTGRLFARTKWDSMKVVIR